VVAETRLQPRIKPIRSTVTKPATPSPIGRLTKGMKIIPTLLSGKAHAVRVRAE
jgi:hypothetical protein